MRWPVKIVLAVLLVAITIVVDFWVSRPSIHLKITHRAIEQGRPVVFFRLEGVGTNSMILNVSRMGRNLHDYGFVPLGPDYLGPAPDFWAPSEGTNPLASVSQTEFGVLVPTNRSVWKLRVALMTDVTHSWRNLRHLWVYLVREPLQASKSIRFLWTHPTERFETIESPRIINTGTATQTLEAKSS